MPDFHRTSLKLKIFPYIIYIGFSSDHSYSMYFLRSYSITPPISCQFTFPFQVHLHIILQEIIPTTVLMVVASIAGATIDAGLAEPYWLLYAIIFTGIN